MIEIADKFNMVDMGGIDVVESQGVAVDGLFTRLLNAIQNCRYQILYNWKFAQVEITPSPIELVFDGEKVSINDAITVTEDDVVHIYSLEPVIESLTVMENGVYEAPLGVDGYNPVVVETRSKAPYLIFRTGAAYFEFSNWLYVDDDFDFIYRNISPPNSAGNWPIVLTSAPNPTSAGTEYFFIQYNFYSGRRVMNIRHGGVWSGDGNYSYDSPYDYDNFYKLSKRGNEFTLYKGATVESLSTVAFTASLGTATSPTPSPLKMLYTNSTFEVYIHSLVGYSGSDIIHNYIAGEDGSLIDTVDDITIAPSGTGTTFTIYR